MYKRKLKDTLYGDFARIGRALASPHRLEMLDLLGQSERTVESLAGETGLSVANASQHLQILRETRLVEARRQGNRVYQRLAGEDVSGLLRQLEAVGESRLAEVRQVVEFYFNRRDALEPITAHELLDRVLAGEALMIDVRPREEFQAGHVPGALSIPVSELESRLQELPRDCEIVAYCRGPYCMFSLDAVELLRRHNFPARRMRGGFPDWRLHGLPVAVGAAN